MTCGVNAARGVQELAAEKGELRKTQRELKRQHKQLARDKEAKEALLAELDAKARDVQARTPSRPYLRRSLLAGSLLHWALDNAEFSSCMCAWVATLALCMRLRPRK